MKIRLTKKTILFVVAPSLLLMFIGSLVAIYFIFLNKPQEIKQVSTRSVAPTPSPTPSPIANPSPTLVPTKAVSSSPKWPVMLSLDQAESLTVVVNKKHRLPSNYAPPDLISVAGGILRSDAAAAYQRLASDATAKGFSIYIISSYRSYQTQVSTYNGFAARDGQALADTYSARPGHSEHQTGLAVDIGLSGGNCALQSCFGDTDVGRWLAERASYYGFIVRYPKGKEAITGYQYEPWHLRYLGMEIAKSVEATGKTLDEFYTVPAGGYQ